MSRKVFISFLGKTDYSECKYGNPSSEKVKYIQEATLYHLNAKQWPSDSAAYILLTKDAESANWNDNGHIDRTTKERKENQGLKKRLELMELPFSVMPIDKLPDGNNENEIWTIFQRVFDVIKDGDELYFDLTHGFRYLPMLILVLGNYSKFLKAVTVKSITYGNFESSKDGIAPIIDITSLSLLQDWTFAAGQYLKSGNAERLVELCQDEIKPVLKETKGADENARNLKNFISKLSSVVEERQTCRGMDIIKSTSLGSLKNISTAIKKDTIVKPFYPIFEKIKSSLEPFDEKENIKNGLMAASWCYDNGLYQQAATILQEFVVSFFCLRHGIKINDDTKREIINSAFTIKDKKLPEDEWKNTNEQEIAKIKEVLDDELFCNSELISYFKNLTEVRNDFNHSGMRSKREPMKPSNIKANIKKCIDGFRRLLI